MLVKHRGENNQVVQVEQARRPFQPMEQGVDQSFEDGQRVTENEGSHIDLMKAVRGDNCGLLLVHVVKCANTLIVALWRKSRQPPYSNLKLSVRAAKDKRPI